MHFIILTLYPELFDSFLASGLLNKAREDGKIRVDVVSFREFGLGRHRNVDAPPYGGGAGMLLRPEPVIEALESCESRFPGRELKKVLISPQGTPYCQEKAKILSGAEEPVILICGRFEGFDERIRRYIDEEISIGDFILMGGEIAAMAIIESVSRLVPGVVGNSESLDQESFNRGLLEHDQYTRPFDFRGDEVPEILLSGNHQKIREWCQANAIEKTRKKRPDLFERVFPDEN